jgi:2-methylcitrate dehydratase PrpD
LILSAHAAGGPTRELAEFVAGLTFEALPDAVVAQACNVILDTVGCALGAWRDDPEKAGIAREIALSFASHPVSCLWGGAGARADSALAALANGILVNAADYDDTHKRALIHTGSVTVPPSLAVAEERQRDGRAAITAVIAGYEVAVRVGMAVMPTHYRFWHSTATNGTFGAAAGAAHAYGLDANRTLMALGFAGTQAAGLNTFFTSGDFTKSLHPGKASFNGILAARLAEVGATSPPAILEHEKGYLQAFSLEPDFSTLTDGLGSRWEILQNGVKPFPSILASHSAIQATLDIVTAHDIEASDIAAITNETYETVKTHFSAKGVETPMAARVSVPYCVAVAALDRCVGQAQFKPQRIAAPDVRDLLMRTDVVAVPELTALYPEKFPARVTVVMKDGRKLTATHLFPKGDPQAPLSAAEIEAKFVDNASARLAETQARKLAGLIRSLPGAKDLSQLSQLLAS